MNLPVESTSPSSPSKISILVKSEFPMPMMIMLRGKWDADTID